MAAIISGSTLSMLFYDHSSTLGNQEGLLTGKVINHVKDTISDSQINNVKVETNIFIYGCTCQSRFESFHDNKGNVCGIDKSVVGWYRYRHNTSHRMSMKEKSLHQSLLKNIPPDKQENFIFVLCTSQKSENLSTCNFDHTFYKYDIRERKYEVVPVTVINLGDTTHDGYKCTRSCTVDYDSGALGSLLSTFEHELLGKGKKTSEAAGVQKMAESLQTQLQCLTHGVMETDQELYQLHTELEQMELQLQRKRDRKKAMKPLPPSPTSPECMDDHPTKVTNEEAIARLKREQKRKQQQKLYPNLSDLKVSSSGSRTRRLSEDNYLIDINEGKTSSRNTQNDKNHHILDSPIEAAEEETLSPESNLLVGNSATQQNDHIEDKHSDIPFADGESHEPSSRMDKKGAKNRTDVTVEKGKSSDPFAFVQGMMATSKNNNNEGAKMTESARMTRSRNNPTTSTNQSRQQNTKQNKMRAQRSRSREKQTDKIQNNQQNSAGSDEDIFDTKDDNVNGVIDISSSPVF